MMHEPVDDGGSQGIVDVEDLAPFAKEAIGRDHDGSTLIAGGDDLEHQIGSPFVDRQIPQFVEQQQFGTGVLFQLLFQRPIDLRGGENIDQGSFAGSDPVVGFTGRHQVGKPAVWRDLFAFSTLRRSIM